MNTITEEHFYKITFHKPNGILDGFFKNVKKEYCEKILQSLPQRWIAIVYNENLELIEYSHTNTN
jgi:hypothetical protein